MHQGPGAGCGPDQAGHVSEVRAQKALVRQCEFPFLSFKAKYPLNFHINVENTTSAIPGIGGGIV